MWTKCKEKDYESLGKYLEKDRILHTFLIADIDLYGFTNDFQQVYMTADASGNCTSVTLVFHNNLIMSGDVGTFDFEGASKLLTPAITNIMGEGGLVQAMAKYLEVKEGFVEKIMYRLDSDEKLMKPTTINVATQEDVDAIHDFLMTIDEIKHLYGNKAMISNRIASGEGVHLCIERDGVIIAHANSAAGTSTASMIGGVAVDKEHRNKGLGKEILSQVSRQVLAQGQVACAFEKSGYSHHIFEELGFEPHCRWGMLRPN